MDKPTNKETKKRNKNYVTHILVTLCIIGFMWQGYKLGFKAIESNYNVDEILDIGGQLNILPIHKNVTSVFLHIGIYHLTANLLGIVIFGNLVERYKGHKITFIVFITGAILGNLTTHILMHNMVTVGASGGIYSLIGVVIYMLIVNRINRRANIPLIVLIILSIVSTFTMKNINIISHIVGLITGIIIGVCVDENIKLAI